MANDQEEDSQSGASEHQSEEEVPVDDDSFSYAIQKNKPKKTEQKRAKAKEKGIQAPQNKIKNKRQKSAKEEGKDNTVEYVSVSTSKVKDLKIFNPIQYYENIGLKNKYEKQLEMIYEEFGKKFNKVEQPPNQSNSWEYLLKQIREVGADFSS